MSDFGSGMLLSWLLAISLYAVGILLAYAAGVPDALSTLAWLGLCIGWSIVTGVVAGAWIGRS